MGKKKIFVAIASLTLVFLLLLFFLKPKTKAPSPLIPTLFPNEIPWETYLNQDYQYAISHPSNWTVSRWDIRQAANLTKIPDGSIWHQAEFKGEKAKFEVLIWENKTKAPLRTWLSWFRHEDLNLEQLPEKENFEVGGIPAILYSQKDSARGKPLDHIFFGWDDRVYEFIEEKETDFNYDKIISTFCFLEDEVKVEPQAEILVNLTKEDLSQRLGVKMGEIRLLKIEEVDWPDTSLGCPQPGMFYAQVITPGYKITLEGRGKSYVYHSDYNRVIFCENSQ